MENFILLHGYRASPDMNFFGWLKRELEAEGHEVSVPVLPNTGEPDIAEQIAHVLKNENFDENTVLLGHSLGSVVALKVAESLEKPIKRLILTAGFSTPFKRMKFEGTFDWEFDCDKIKKNSGDVTILRDLGDKRVPARCADTLKEKFGGKLVDFDAEEQHVTAEKEPVVLKHCLNQNL